MSRQDEIEHYMEAVSRWKARAEKAEAEIDRLHTLTDAVREFCEDDGDGTGYPDPIDHKYEAVLAALRALTEDGDR